MADQVSSIDPTIDPYGNLGMVRHADGSIERLHVPLHTCPSPNPTYPPSLLTKLLPINQSKSTWARIFLPRETVESSDDKLPLIIYFHGGGFVLCSVDTPVFCDFYTAITTMIPAVIVSVGYRLAPEHRLPAAYEDAMEALHWIKTFPDEWLEKHADFSNCYLMGTSAGGNMAYHVGLRAVGCVNDLEPLRIRGLILHHPFFGGVKRTQSEVRLINDTVLPPCITDIMWELGLPEGADRDHEYCNPMVGIKSNLLSQVRVLGIKILVSGCDGDAMIDRQREVVKMLEEKGVQVSSKFDEGGCHGLEILHPLTATPLCGFIKEFITTSAVM